MTTTRSLTYSTTLRLCVTMRIVRLNSARMSLSRFRIWAWAETSSDATGSSQKMNRGFRASAVAIPMRWRSPPLNSCGYQLAW